MSWTKIDKIAIIYNRDTGKDGVKQAYVSDAKNKNTMETGIRWSKSDNPDIAYVDNSGFSAEIISSAGHSSQGGRLSFWTVKITKDGIEPFYVGVNSDLLVKLIKESHINFGYVSERVIFAKENGRMGLLHKNMASYKDMIDDDNKRKEHLSNKVKKTKAWIPGCTYKTLTQEDMCLGEFMPILNLYDIDFNVKPIFISGYSTNFNIKKMVAFNLIKYPTWKKGFPAREFGRKIYEPDYFRKKIAEETISQALDSHNVEDLISIARALLAITNIDKDGALDALREIHRRVELDAHKLTAERDNAVRYHSKYNPALNVVTPLSPYEMDWRYDSKVYHVGNVAEFYQFLIQLVDKNFPYSR